MLSTLHDGNHGYPRVGVPILGTGRETRRLARPPVRGTRSRYTYHYFVAGARRALVAVCDKNVAWDNLSRLIGL